MPQAVVGAIMSGISAKLAGAGTVAVLGSMVVSAPAGEVSYKMPAAV